MNNKINSNALALFEYFSDNSKLYRILSFDFIITHLKYVISLFTSLTIGVLIILLFPSLITIFIATLLISIAITISPPVLAITFKKISQRTKKSLLLQGLEFSSFKALTTLTKINTIAFEKNNIITENSLQVAEIFITSNISNKEIIKIIADLTRNSNNLIYSAIEKYSISNNINLNNNIYNEIKSNQYFLGDKALMLKRCIAITTFEMKIKSFLLLAMIPLYLVKDNTIVAIIAFKRPIMNNTKKFINELKLQKLKTLLLTYDNNVAAHYLANQTNIDIAIGEGSANKKANIIKNLQMQGNKIALVTDQHNNSALEKTDVLFIKNNNKNLINQSNVINLPENSSLQLIINCLNESKKMLLTIKLQLLTIFLASSAILSILLFIKFYLKF